VWAMLMKPASNWLGAMLEPLLKEVTGKNLRRLRSRSAAIGKLSTGPA